FITGTSTVTSTATSVASPCAWPWIWPQHRGPAGPVRSAQADGARPHRRQAPSCVPVLRPFILMNPAKCPRTHGCQRDQDNAHHAPDIRDVEALPVTSEGATTKKAGPRAIDATTEAIAERAADNEADGNRDQPMARPCQPYAEAE